MLMKNSGEFLKKKRIEIRIKGMLPWILFLFVIRISWKRSCLWRGCCGGLSHRQLLPIVAAHISDLEQYEARIWRTTIIFKFIKSIYLLLDGFSKIALLLGPGKCQPSPPSKGCPNYDAKMYLLVKTKFWKMGSQAIVPIILRSIQTQTGRVPLWGFHWWVNLRW